MSFLNLATRVAILPVLALTLPNPPALGPLAVGSFALLYSQLVLPTPPGPARWSSGFWAERRATWEAAKAGCCWPGDSTPTAIGVILGVVLAVADLWLAGAPAASGAVERSPTSSTVRSSASATPCGHIRGRPDHRAGPRLRVSTPTVMRARPAHHQVELVGAGVHVGALATAPARSS